MKTNRNMLFAFGVLLLAGFLTTAQAGEDDNNCYLEASVDARVEVWNLDDDGNKGYLIWKGVIKQGDRKLIRSIDGRIRYASTTNLEENTALDGDVDRWCNNGSSIGVP